MTPMAWSYSRLSDFETCALRFQHKYVLKTIKFVSNAAMDRGKELHKQLERDTVRAIHGKEPVCQDIAHVHPMIKGFVARHPAVSIEQQLAFDSSLNPTDWFAKDVWFRAVIDMVGRTNVQSKIQDHGASVVDWKTGQFRPTVDQLKIYNMAVMLQWSQTASVTSALVFIDHKKSSPPLTSSRLDLQNLVQEFSDRSEAIQIAIQRDSWQPTKCFQCRWCEVNTCQYITR